MTLKSNATTDEEKNPKKNWLVIWKFTWGIWQIFTREFDSPKIGTFMGSFYPKKKMYALKIYGELCVMTMKNDAKFGEKLPCRFKIDVRNLGNFDSKLSKICTSVGSFWVMFDSTGDGCEIWRKANVCFQKWHEEFAKFSQTKK